MEYGTLISWTLDGTYLIHGQVTGFEYEDLPGVEVTVENLTTGESATTTADDSGAFSVDLGSTTDFPAGYSVGDEIAISATHRGAPRTWKRRVSGTEIVQDLHFTHGTWKGALRRAKMLQIDVLTGKTGTTLTLRDATTRDVVTVKINGEELADTEWTFTRPSTLVIDAGVSTSDVIEVERTTNRSIQEAKDEVVAEGDSQVRNATARHYASPLPDRVPELQDISEALAAARMRDLIHTGGERGDAEAASLRKYARDRLKELYDGTRNLTDQDGAWITPSLKSTTIPKSSATPTRQQNRFTESNTKKDLW